MAGFSVVIPTHQRPDALRQCLERLAPGAQTLAFEDYEVIVVDGAADGSDTETIVKTNFKWATWEPGPGGGAAANRNQGARIAHGRWLVFTDDDCLPTEKWLAGFRRASKGNDSEILEGMTVPDREWPGPGWVAPINRTGGRLWTCNLAVEKNFYWKMGGFDELCRYDLEDVDFRIRARKRVDSIPFVQEAIVVHPWRQRKSPVSQFKALRSWWYMCHKHPEVYQRINVKYIIGALAKLVSLAPKSVWSRPHRREAACHLGKVIKGILLYCLLFKRRLRAWLDTWRM